MTTPLNYSPQEILSTNILNFTDEQINFIESVLNKNNEATEPGLQGLFAILSQELNQIESDLDSARLTIKCIKEKLNIKV